MNILSTFNYLAFVLLTLSLLSCEKLNFSNELNYPITTIEILDSEDGQFTVRGEVIAPSGNIIESVSVNWYPPNKFSYREQPRYLIPVNYTPGSPFTVKINRDLISGQDYRIRFIYQLASGERMYSQILSAKTEFSGPSPMQEVSEFSQLLAETTDDFTVEDGQLTLIADNVRYLFNGSNFVPTNGIPNGDLSVQNFFQFSSGDNRFLLKIGGSTLYAKARSPGRWQIWQHVDGSTSITQLGDIPIPKDIFTTGNRIFFTQDDFRLWEMILEPELRVESIDNIPRSNTTPIIGQYFAGSEQSFYLLEKSNASVLGTIQSTLQLLRYDLNTNSWEELPAPPGSSDGYLWMSAEPSRLLFGGELTGLVPENDIWLLDFNNSAQWEFIGWLPTDFIIKSHKPRFVDGKHHYIGLNSRRNNEPAYLYSIDLDLLEDL